MFTLAPGLGALLSLTFLVSAFGKFADLEGTETALRSLRLPAKKFHRIFAVLTPVCELLVAVGVWLPWRVPAALAALLGLVMMAVFTVVIARSLSFNKAVHCSCFGTLGSPVVSQFTLARNVLLSVIALGAFLCAALHPGLYPGLLLQAAPVEAVLLVTLLVAAATVTLLVVGGTNRLAGEQASAGTGQAGAAPAGSEAAAAPTSTPEDTAAPAEDDYIRTPIPFASLTDLAGTRHTLRDLASTQAVLLLFFSTGCGACHKVFGEVAGWQKALAPFVRVITVFSAELDKMDPEIVDALGDTRMHDEFSRTAQIFDSMAWPSAVLLGADGLVAGGPVVGSGTIREFVGEILAQLEEAPALEEAVAAAYERTPEATRIEGGDNVTARSEGLDRA